MKSKVNILIYMYEMIGGIFGLCITVHLAWSTTNIIIKPSKSVNYQLLFSLIYLFAFVLYTLSFIAGFLLWKKRKRGILLSIIVQIFQIPYITIPCFMYSFISGLQLGISVSISPTMFKISGLFYLGSTFGVYFGKIIYMIIGINFIPIAVIYYLIRIQKVTKINQLKEENEVLNDTI